MIRIAAWALDMSDAVLTRLVQLGVDCADGMDIPIDDLGVYDLEQAIAIKQRIHSFGLQVNRVTLAYSKNFVDRAGGWDEELERNAASLRVLGEAGYPVVRVGFHYMTDTGVVRGYEGVHRGGYTMRGGSLAYAENPEQAAPEVREQRWEQVCRAYESMVPIAEEYGTKLMMHPADPPTTDTMFGGLGYHRLIDAFPSPCVGYLYCVGTRAEAGGSALVLDEINNYGRKGRIFEVHFRNVRGSLPTAGAFEEVLLDDGDMNMFRILKALHSVGFDGCLHSDHHPTLEGDDAAVNHMSTAYSIGYMKALLAALACD